MLRYFITVFRSLIIFAGILFWSVDLQLLNEEIIFDISSPVAGAVMNDSKLLGGRNSSINLLENFIFG